MYTSVYLLKQPRIESSNPFFNFNFPCHHFFDLDCTEIVDNNIRVTSIQVFINLSIINVLLYHEHLIIKMLSTLFVLSATVSIASSLGKLVCQRFFNEVVNNSH